MSEETIVLPDELDFIAVDKKNISYCQRYKVVDADTGEHIIDNIKWADADIGVYARFVRDGKNYVRSKLGTAKRELVHRNIRIVLKTDSESI